MKKAIFISVILLIIIVESRGQRQAGNNDDIIKVDVKKDYPSKKELILQDFMDVEYVVLETNNIFINQGIVRDIGKKFIVVTNDRVRNGDIFIYNRTGKALRKINRKGNSGEEYIDIFGIILDEDKNEIFVNDITKRKIFVYDLHGKFKRSFKHRESAENPYYTPIFNYDKDNLICYDQDSDKNRTFVLISKKDGSIIHKVKVPFKEDIPIRQRWNEGTHFIGVSPGHYRTIIPFKGSWTLLELSSDTVYAFLPDYKLHPFLVRTPSIQSMNPRVFLLLSFFSDRYYFMETMKCEIDKDTRTGFPRTPFMYDKQEKAFFRYTVYNGDYSTKNEILMNVPRPVNHDEIESWQKIEAYQLVEDYKKGILKGKLKEIAATLDEESNPVIMLIKHKK